MNTMTVAQFNPHDSTGPDDTDVLFKSCHTGPQGARFELFKEKHHTDDDIKRAKNYIRKNFDVVSINIINER